MTQDNNTAGNVNIKKEITMRERTIFWTGISGVILYVLLLVQSL
jgi:hypothetical protein